MTMLSLVFAAQWRMWRMLDMTPEAKGGLSDLFSAIQKSLSATSATHFMAKHLSHAETIEKGCFVADGIFS